MPKGERSQRYDLPVEQRVRLLENNLRILRERQCERCVKLGEAELTRLKQRIKQNAGGR